MLQQNGPLPQSPQIWLPSADSFGLDAPNSSQLWYVWDEQQLGKHRRVFIRNEMLNEFPNSSVYAPPLSVLVVKVFDWHLRVPIWRGPTFFSSELSTDAAAMMTVAECIKRGWCDRDAISNSNKAGVVAPWQA